PLRVGPFSVAEDLDGLAAEGSLAVEEHLRLRPADPTVRGPDHLDHRRVLKVEGLMHTGLARQLGRVDEPDRTVEGFEEPRVLVRPDLIIRDTLRGRPRSGVRVESRDEDIDIPIAFIAATEPGGQQAAVAQ